MFPRYGRKNRKYKVKAPKSKMSYFKKLKLQSILSLFLLIVGILLSFFSFMPAKRINTYLYDTYTVKQWAQSFLPLKNSVVEASVKIASKYMSFFSNNESEDKTKEKSIDTPIVKAQKKEDTVRQEETKKEFTNQNAVQEIWKMPMEGEISSLFGERIHPLTGEKTVHTGIDIAANTGDAVYAVHSGTVEKVGYDEANGNYIILSHGNTITSVYIHLSSVKVTQGQTISTDTKIGEAGSTGISTGPHLHFEIKENGVSVDPKKYIKEW